MVGKLVRGGVSVLALLTVTASGAAVGVAHAAGSSDDASCGVPYGDCVGVEQLGYGSRGDVNVIYLGDYYAVVGQDITFIAELRPSVDEGPTPGVVISSVTHGVPEGFTFTGSDVTSYEETPGVYPVKALESSAAVDPETGDVTVTAPGEGWTVPNRAARGTVYVKLHYRLTKPITEEFVRSHITFAGPDVPASDEWVASGATYPGVVNPAIFGSSGS